MTAHSRKENDEHGFIRLLKKSSLSYSTLTFLTENTIQYLGQFYNNLRVGQEVNRTNCPPMIIYTPNLSTASTCLSITRNSRNVEVTRKRILGKQSKKEKEYCSISNCITEHIPKAANEHTILYDRCLHIYFLSKLESNKQVKSLKVLLYA